MVMEASDPKDRVHQRANDHRNVSNQQEKVTLSNVHYSHTGCAVHQVGMMYNSMERYATIRRHTTIIAGDLNAALGPGIGKERQALSTTFDQKPDKRVTCHTQRGKDIHV